VTEKFIGYFRFVEACAQTGCPACRSLEQDGRRYLEAFIYEQVTDPDTRRGLHASWGFCNWHTWMLLEVADASSGAAIVYADLIQAFLHRFRRLRDRAPSFPQWSLARLFRRRGPTVVELQRRRNTCPVCAWCAQAEAGYLATLLQFIDDPQFARAYAKSEGICAPHLLAAVELGGSSPGLAHLLDRTVAKWEELRKDVDRFVSKHDYRNRAPFTEAEASSPRRAFEALGGRRGVWGNDLHGRAVGVFPPPYVRTAAAAGDAADPGAAFERAKLELRLKELAEQLNEATSRSAALHYRLSKVAEDRNALELNLSGERGANELAMRTIVDLQIENAQLRAELDAARGASLESPPGEA
jgi:uncharacterized protein DUF6062